MPIPRPPARLGIEQRREGAWSIVADGVEVCAWDWAPGAVACVDRLRAGLPLPTVYEPAELTHTVLDRTIIDRRGR